MGLSDEYITQAIENHFANKTTKNTYVSKITRLSKMLNKPIYDILKDPQNSFNSIKQLYPASVCSQINIVTLIMSIFKTIPELMKKKSLTWGEWRAIYEKLKVAMPAKREAAITKAEVDNKYVELKDHQSSQEFLLLSMIKHLKVPKADYSKVYIVYPPARQSLNRDYLVLNHKPYLVLDKVRYFLPTELAVDIKESVRLKPREYLFGPYHKTNSYNIFFIRAFEGMFGKRVGVNGVKGIL